MLKLIAYVSLFFLIISSFSDRISPLVFPYIAYFGLFFPLIFASNILFFLFWLILGKCKQVFVTLIVFGICWEAICIYFPIHISNNRTENIPEGCIRILTYNVMHFGCLEHTKKKYNSILQYVIKQNFDIICFQEFDNGNLLPLSVIRNALKANPYYFILPCGVALFSKYPILSIKKVPFDASSYNGALIAELNVNKRRVTLVNCHLESNKISDNEKLDYTNLIKALDIRKLKAFMHMIFHKLIPAFKMRAIQSTVIAELIRESKNPYFIICGDFNDTPISYAYRKIKGDLKDTFVESGYGRWVSFNANCFLFRIDYIFCSKNIQAYHTTMGNLKSSDHYPMQTYLQFKNY